MSRLAFPYGVTALGQSAAVDYGSDAHVRQMLELLIFTMPDERVMRPGLGSPVRQMVFGPGGGPVAIALEASLQAAVQQWLGHVLTLIDLSVTAADGDAVLDVAVTYEVTATKQAGSLNLRKDLDMTGAVYLCCDPARRARLKASGPAGISGIDYVEVRQGDPISVPTEIDIVLVTELDLPGAALTPANIAITGGVRFPPPQVDSVQALPGPNKVSRYRVTLAANQPTDFSTYRLDLLAGAGAPPAFIDPRLSGVEFSFKVDCPSDFDCAPDCTQPPDPPPVEPAFSYLARDWAGFRQLMLDRMAVLLPDFRQDDPVDLTTTLIEVLAWRADQQSYRLDWVATEALPDSARSRASMTRHARLVDYAPGEGASARAFVAFGFTAGVGPMADGMVLPAGTPLLPRTEGLPVVVKASLYAGLASDVVFETMAPLALWQWRSTIALHLWSDDLCTLPRGATSVTLVDGSGGAGGLAAGDFLLLAQIAAPDTGASADADPSRRHVVRLTRVTPVTDVLAPGLALVDVAWAAEDALPFDLPVTAEVAQPSGPALRVTCAAAQGNLVLADHGRSLPPPAHLGLPPATLAADRPRLDPPAPEPGAAWRPALIGPGPLARLAPARPGDLPPPSAAALLAVDPAACLPAVALIDSFAPWTVRRDLLASGRFDRDFVVETGPSGETRLRFGDGSYGLAPATGAAVGVSARFGSGTAGLLGAGALGHVVLDDTLAAAGIGAVANPRPATGGAEPESIAQIRIAAPQAFRVQDRAVTAADYAEVAMRFPGVANAVAVPRWTGAWQTMLIHIDRSGGLPLDAGFRAALLEHVEHFRLAGFDVALRPALASPLDIALAVCARPDSLRASVGQAVRAALSPFGPADGSPGFFHPDNFTFGTVLYLSRLIGAVMAVPGVQSVTATTFQRFGRLPQGELEAGAIRPVGPEVLQLSDDPSFPERGRLAIAMGGGR